MVLSGNFHIECIGNAVVIVIPYYRLIEDHRTIMTAMIVARNNCRVVDRIGIGAFKDRQIMAYPDGIRTNNRISHEYAIVIGIWIVGIKAKTKLEGIRKTIAITIKLRRVGSLETGLSEIQIVSSLPAIC